MYLTGDFTREMLTERKDRLQSTIDALEQERVDLQTQLEAAVLTDEQIETIMEFTAVMKEGLKEAEQDFGKRRWIIDALDVTARLTVEDGKKVAHVKCHIGKDVLEIVSMNT